MTAVPIPTTRLSEEDLAAAQRMIESNKTLAAIGDALGIHRSSVAKVLGRHGIKVGRRRSTAPDWVRDHELTVEQDEILLGEMFGGGALVSSPEGVAYRSAHPLVECGFAEWKANRLSPLTSRHRRTSRRLSVEIETWPSRLLVPLWEEWYSTGTKVPTPGAAKRSTPLSLAVWFMWSGEIVREMPVFHVDLRVDLPPIADVLSEVFDQRFEGRRYDRRWHLCATDSEKFWATIEPCVIAAMRRKLPPRLR